MRITLSRFALASVFIGLLATTSAAQDFHKTYTIGTGGRISIKNVSGRITVTGYDGPAIVVNGFKEGRDRDLVQVEDLSSSDHLDLRVRYPENCNCDASIRFEVQVPRSVNYQFDRLSTASGNIEVRAVTGDLNVKSASGRLLVKEVTGPVSASTASGNVRVENSIGSVKAHSASGNVEVAIARLEGSTPMEFTTASGDVRVRLPADLDADVEISSMSGSLKTDFPLQVQEQRHGPGQHVRGRIGAGSRQLRISSASGNVSLERY